MYLYCTGTWTGTCFVHVHVTCTYICTCAVTSCVLVLVLPYTNIHCALNFVYNIMCVHVYSQPTFTRLWIFSRSWFLVPFVHTVVWYFAVDSVTMFWSFCRMRDQDRPGERPGLRRWLGQFIRKKWTFLLHHMLIFTVAYPLVVVSFF